MTDSLTLAEQSAHSAGVPSTEELGVRIRRLRGERGWTLHDLAERAGVSLSTLSKIEKAQVAPTFDTLVKTAHGLGIRFEVLIADPAEAQGPAPADPVVQRRAVGGRLMVTRSGDAIEFSTPMYEYRVHANALRRKFMTPLIMEIKARTDGDATGWSSHEGEEFILVMAGAVELHTEFYDPVRLETGDSAYIDSGMAHMFLAVGAETARIASICYSEDIEQPEVMVTIPALAI